MAVFNGKDYQGWTEDLDYYFMGLELKDDKDSERMLGIFISHGDKLRKRLIIYLRQVGTPAAEASVYTHLHPQ